MGDALRQPALLHLDPVSRASATAESGFFWDTLDVSDRPVRAFYHDAKSHGVGPSGYTLPIITERGDKIAISVSSPDEREAFRERIRHYEEDLLTLGFCITEAFSRLASDDRPMAFTPTDDQMAILRAVAMGADEEELRAGKYLYGSYSRSSARSAACSAPARSRRRRWSRPGSAS